MSGVMNFKYIQIANGKINIFLTGFVPTIKINMVYYIKILDEISHLFF